MVTIEPSRDFELIRDVMTHPKVWARGSDDYSGRPQDFQPSRDERILYLVAKDGGRPLGIWMLTPENGVCLQVHTCFLPSAFHSQVLTSVKLALEWTWAKTRVQRIITKVPAFNIPAARLAREAGMERFGCSPREFCKDGTLQRVDYFGISRPEENKCQRQ
jgi:hypothetical protein